MTLHTERDAARPKASDGQPRDAQLDPVRLDRAHDLPDANSISCEGKRENVVAGCAACEALAKRVGQLEQDFAALARRSVPFPESTVLGTTVCYWIIIGIHCVLIGLSALGIELMGILLYPLLVGAVGSLIVCHVLANRSVLHKFARTLLSSFCVCSVATLALTLSAGSFVEVLQMQLVFVPPIFFASWFATKILAWTRGWLIIPPQNDGVKFPLEIRDMFVVTLVFAVYFGVARAFIDVSKFNLNDRDSWPMLSLVVIACMLGTIAAAMIARGALVAKIQIRWLLGACLVTTLGLNSVVGVFLAMYGDWGDGSGAVVYVFYALLFSLLVMLSPMITFLLMRSARYRFATRSLVGGVSTAN